MALAVNTPTHLREIGLLPEKKNDYESEKEDIAYLFHVALQKVGSKFRLSFRQNLPIFFSYIFCLLKLKDILSELYYSFSLTLVF